MPDKKPTHEQGQLQLQLYDLRREAKLRQARDWFTQSYFVDSFEDSQRIAPFGSQEGTYLFILHGSSVRFSTPYQAVLLTNGSPIHREAAYRKFSTSMMSLLNASS
jgi:hypothetical protein